jgi:hypothetical protein
VRVTSGGPRLGVDLAVQDLAGQPFGQARERLVQPDIAPEWHAHKFWLGVTITCGCGLLAPIPIAFATLPDGERMLRTLRPPEPTALAEVPGSYRMMSLALIRGNGRRVPIGRNDGAYAVTERWMLARCNSARQIARCAGPSSRIRGLAIQRAEGVGPPVSG